MKIEVNGTKRGIFEAVEDRTLCAKAQSEFNMGCIARTVPFSQLYGGKINAILTKEDKAFLISFKEGEPQWDNSEYSHFKDFPSIQWKLLNISKLKTQNPAKHKQEVKKLKTHFEQAMELLKKSQENESSE